MDEEKNEKIARKVYGDESFERNPKAHIDWVDGGRSLFDLIKKAQETSSFDELETSWQRAFISMDEAYKFWH